MSTTEKVKHNHVDEQETERQKIISVISHMKSNIIYLGKDTYRPYYRQYARSVIIDSMQRGVRSPLFDERLLYSDKKWKNELSKQDIKYIKDTLFDILFEKPFDEYAKGIQTSEEKIDLVHSKLKSMYREQKEFVKELVELADNLNKNGENNHS